VAEPEDSRALKTISEPGAVIKMKKGDVVGYDAGQHTTVVQVLEAEGEDLKLFNLFRHIEDSVSGAKVVDLGCGAGDISRRLIDEGAELALGIDSKPEMIELASDQNGGYNDRVIFIEADVGSIKGDHKFDIAIASYLYNNAKSAEQLMNQVATTASFLRPGGIAVVFNNNPYDLVGGDFTKYGFRKTLTGTHEGTKIIYDYRPIITDDIINYYLSPMTHETAFREAGFKSFRFEPVILRPGADTVFWHDYFDRPHLPVIGMIAIK
jgi:SAM-dependent methyltransferase